jgi:hypothetical protein
MELSMQQRTRTGKTGAEPGARHHSYKKKVVGLQNLASLESANGPRCCEAPFAAGCKAAFSQLSKDTGAILNSIGAWFTTQVRKYSSPNLTHG